MRPSGTHLYKRVCPSVGPSIRQSVGPLVRPSVRMSIRYASAKTAFLGCFRPRWDPILKQMINQHVFRASFTTLLLSRFTHLFVPLSPQICHMINTRRDTVRTHRCPVGLVSLFFACERVSSALSVSRLCFAFLVKSGNMNKTRLNGNLHT